MKKIIVSVFAISLAVLTTLVIILHSTSYENCIASIENFLSLNTRNHQQFKEIISVEVFLRIKFSLLISAFLNLIILILLIFKKDFLQVPSRLLKPLVYFPKWLFINFKNLNNSEKILLVSCLILVAVQRHLLSFNTSVIYDEAWTYLAFTSKNPVVAACFYPSSNNHILYSHFSQITKFLPFDILTNLRSPAIFMGLMCVVVFFFFAKQYLKKNGLWISVLVFSFSFPAVYYGFAARGYSTILLFFIIGFFSALKILEESSNSQYWSAFSLSSALGFYTIPVYLYPFVTISLFLFLYFLINKIRSGFISLIKYVSFTSFMVLILYLPVFIVSGLNSVVGNKFVKSHDLSFVLSNFTGHISNSIKFFTASELGYIVLGVLLLLLIFSHISGKIKSSKLVIFSLMSFIIIPFLIFAHRVIPVERTWIYLLVPLSLVCGKIAEFQFMKYILFALCLINFLNISYNWKKQMIWYDNICEEDYEQGEYFTNYFKNKTAKIVAENRMNSYLKFNNLLYNQNWEILNKMPVNTDKNTFLILHKSEKYLNKDIKETHYFKNYYLYSKSEK